jgi:hypothetical protein
MKPESLREQIISFLTRASSRDQEKGGDGTRTVRDMLDWIGNNVLVPDVNRELKKMEAEGLVENFGKIEGLGNSIFWGFPVPEQKNTLVVIGYMGVKRAYLNMSEEDALQRHLECEWPEGWDAATEEDTRSRMTSFEFSDCFSVYDAGPA